MEATVSYLLIATKIYQFKAEDSEIKKHPSCLGNTSGDLKNKIKCVCVWFFCWI